METPWYVLLKDGKIGDQFSRENACSSKFRLNRSASGKDIARN